MPQMMADFTLSSSSGIEAVMRCKVVFILLAPKPRDVHNPNVVQAMDIESIKSPNSPLT